MRSRIPAAAALAATLAASTSANAFELKHGEGGALVRWHRASVTLTVDRSLREVRGGEKAVSAAVAAWTKRGGAPSLAAFKSGVVLKPGFDGTSAVFFAREGFAPAGAALAVTILSFDDQTGEVLDADIVLNGKYPLGPVDARASAPRSEEERSTESYDIDRIVAHEMGHALGLSDELARKDALMYPYVARAEVLAAAPGADDLEGLQALYASTPATTAVPAEAGHAGCSGAVVARSGPNAAPGAAFCAAGLLIGALVMARSKRRGGRGAAGCTVLLAAALVMPPVLGAPETSSGESDADAIVTGVKTTAVEGVFQSEIEVVTTKSASSGRPVKSRAIVWGGTLGGVKQIIGGTVVPSAGDRVGIVLSTRTSGEVVVRIISRVAE